MVEPQPSKLVTWVRFPSPAPVLDTAGVAELADATDLKSVGWKQPYRFDSGPRHHQFHIGNKPLGLLYNADVAESADALVSGTSGGDIVEVQVLSSAPFLCLLLFFDIFAVVAELADALL